MRTEQGAQVIEREQTDRGPQRPPEQILFRLMTEGFHLMRREFVEGDVDLIQRIAIFSTEEFAARGLGDLLQTLKVDLGFARRVRITNADGMN